MIFASVGSMLPFERFVRAVDSWAEANPETRVLIQIGSGIYEPRHASFVRIMPIAEYREHLVECKLFVAHAGIGSILQALEESKQMVLLPRLHALGEHTTDHQLHTAARFRNTPGLIFVETDKELKETMSNLMINPLRTSEAISRSASPELITNVTAFLRSAISTK